MNTKRICIALVALLTLAVAGGWAVLRPRARTMTLGNHAAVTLAEPGTPAPAPTLPDQHTSGVIPSASPLVSAGCPLTEAQVQSLQQVAAFLEGGSQSADATLEPLRAWAAQDLAACARWVLENLNGASRRRCLDEAVAIWVQQQGPQGALDWLDRQNDAPGLDTGTLAGAYLLTLTALAGQDGPAAVSWLRAHAPQGSASNWGNVLETWAETHPTDALQWVTTSGNLEPGLKDALLPNLLTSFRDLGTTDMLLRGSNPAAKDDALANAARATSSLDPAYALSLARMIQNQPVRDDAIQRALARWLETDADAARSFATQANLPLPGSATPGGQTSMKAQPLGIVPPDAPPTLPHN